MRIAFNPSTVAALIAPPNNKDITFDLRGQNIFARGVKFCGTDTNTWRDIKINNVSIDSNTLDLRDSSTTTLTNINGVVTINSTWRPVVDNLTSDSTTSSLSANLGRVLKALIDGKSDSDHNHDDRYLRLTGGLMLGDITFGGDNKIIWGRNTDSASISFKNDGDGDANSYMSFVTSDNGNEYFRWSHSSGSTNTEWMSLRSDGLRVGGTKVSLEGHTHDDRYVKRSGDTMFGALNFANGTWNLVGDDSYMGDCNISGHFGIKAANTTYPGIAFFNNANDHLGNLTAYNGNVKYGAYSLQFLDNGNTSVSAGAWMNPFNTYDASAVTDGQAVCVWGQSSSLSNLAADSGDMSLWLKRVNANVATLNMVLDGEYYANGILRLAHVSEIPTSLKNPYALTISLNGTSQGPYDGSAAKNINITPSSIGAATSDHNHDGRYVYNYGGTQMDGTSINKNALGMTTNSGITEDWWHILQAAWNGEYRWNSLIAFPTLNRNGMYYRSGLDDNTAWGAWVKLLDVNNYSSTLDSRYYTESEVDSLLDAKLNRQNLSYGTWNPRGYSLAADYYYNGGDLSISESGGLIHVSVDGYFWLNEGLYRVLDTSDVAGLKNNLTVHLYLSNTDTTWWPLIWGGSSHNNTSNSTGEVYKSYDKLSWLTSSLTLYATNLYTGRLETVNNHYYYFNSDATLRIYGSPGDNSERIYFLAGIDNRIDDYDIPSYGGELRHSIILNPRGGYVGIGDVNPSYKLSVGGDIGTGGNIYISHNTNDDMSYNTSNPRIVFSENGSLAVGLVYTGYDSYRPSKGLKVMDVNNDDTSNVWFEVLGYNYSSGYVKNGSNDNYVLLGGGGHKLESSLNVASASVASKVYGQVGDTGSHELVRCDMNNDQFRIIAGSNGNNNGWAEIATADDGNEPIYVRQYTGVFSSVVRTLTLLDANGYTHFPSYINIGGNENNNSSPDRVWGSNSSDSYLRSYRTSALNVNYASNAGNADTLDGIDSTGFLRYYNSNSAPSNVDIVNTPSYVWTVSTTGGSVANATKPSGMDNAWGIIHLHTHIGNYATQLGFGGTTSRMYMRNAYNTSTFGNWQALAFTTDNVASATKLQTPRSIWGQYFDGTADVNGTIYINNSDSSNGAIRLNNDRNSNARISAISDQVIFNTGNAIRFGETAWDWNQWAGLKYTHSNKTIYLGLADNSIFNANSALSGGTLNLRAGISNIDLNSGTSIRGLPTNGSPYSSSITLRDTSISLSAYGDISMSTGPGAIKLTSGYSGIKLSCLGNNASVDSGGFKVEASRGAYLNSGNSGNVYLCLGGGNVSIGYNSPSYKLDVNGLMRASGFRHSGHNSDDAVLLAGGGYKTLSDLTNNYYWAYDNKYIKLPICLEFVTFVSYRLTLSIWSSPTYTNGSGVTKLTIPNLTVPYNYEVYALVISQSNPNTYATIMTTTPLLVKITHRESSSGHFAVMIWAIPS